MARKVFISFLGTTRYIKTRYYFREECKNNAELTRFVQYSIIKETCKNWKETDKILFFLTEESKQKNWNDPAHTGHPKGEITGLSKLLNDLNFKSKIKDINISDGFSEEEIWEIFTKVYEKLEENDEIYLDITHAFRFLPMLVMVLLNYAKVNLNISVKHIFYGAFEKLGPSYMVEKIDEDKRFAPIIDLISFADLQDWTNASRGFIKFGNAMEIMELTEKEINPLLKESKGKDETSKLIKGFVKSLNAITQALRTNRGNVILSGNEVAKNIKFIHDIKGKTLPALEPLLNKILDRLKLLNYSNDVINGFRAVKWCIDVNLIQQAYSLLREAVITYVLWHSFPDKFNIYLNDDKKRELVSSAFKISSSSIAEKDWNEFATQNKDFIKKITESCYPKDLIKEYDSLGTYRNDIMHAGFRDGIKKAQDIEKKIKDSFEKIINILEISL